MSGFELLRSTERFSLWGSLGDYCSAQASDFFLHGDFVRVFESCFVTRLDQADSRAEATRLLFSEMAGDTYNSIVDIRRNLECYNKLYVEAEKRAGLSFNNVLDFGCGPGTVLASELYFKVENLVGYDFVEENREHACSLGLHVLSPEEADSLAEESFDFIVCNYVLHYMSIEQRSLNLLIASLKSGGVLAANFHKGTGLDWFLECVRSIAGVSVVREVSSFGDLVLIVKGDSDAGR